VLTRTRASAAASATAKMQRQPPQRCSVSHHEDAASGRINRTPRFFVNVEKWGSPLKRLRIRRHVPARVVRGEAGKTNRACQPNLHQKPTATSFVQCWTRQHTHGKSDASRGRMRSKRVWRNLGMGSRWRLRLWLVALLELNDNFNDNWSF
jgi:hypothetical protein